MVSNDVCHPPLTFERFVHQFQLVGVGGEAQDDITTRAMGDEQRAMDLQGLYSVKETIKPRSHQNSILEGVVALPINTNIT